MLKPGSIPLKAPAEIDEMAIAGALHVECLKLLASKVRPGITTQALDSVAERFILEHDATPSFLGYRGFTGAICSSRNDMVVHGIPGPERLDDGDVISIDLGVTKDGWVADGAVTFAVGEIDEERRNLLEVTRASLFAAVEQCVPGNRLGDVSHAVQSVAEAGGLAVVRSLVGHGIGRDMHEDPQIPNFGPAGRGPVLEAGMVLAIEPMTTAGGHEVRMGDAGWAIYSEDGSPAAHFEFTVAVTADGPRILTPWHEGEGAL
jgi:methionyl aminopeptidase